MELINKIFDLVDKKYKDQKDFAEAINVSASTVSKWRNNDSKSYNHKLQEIAAALGVSISELCGEPKTAPLTDPLSGFDKDKDYLIFLKDKSGHGDTVLASRGVRLPVEAVEVAEAYLSLDIGAKNLVRRMLGLPDLGSSTAQTG